MFVSQHSLIRFKEFQCFKDAFPKGVTGSTLQGRYHEYLDPSKIRGIFTNFEIQSMILLATLVPAKYSSHIAEVFGRTRKAVEIVLRSKTFMKQLLAKLTELTSRTKLLDDEGKFDFGSDSNREKCTQAAIAAYRKNNPIPSNDTRIKDKSTLTEERIVSLASEINLKIAKGKKRSAKEKAKKEQKAERETKRAKKEDEALAFLKTEEELEKLESKEKAAEWVKVRNSARETILAAGHTAESLDRLVNLARVAFKKNPLGRGMSGAVKDRMTKKRDMNRNILAELDNNTNTK